MPIYFAVETPEVVEMYEAIEHGTSTAATRSATEGESSAAPATQLSLCVARAAHWLQAALCQTL